MKKVIFSVAAFTAVCFAVASCSNNNSHQTHAGAIVLGDSSTIVTEKDSNYLKDQVADLEPQATTNTKTDSTPTQSATPPASPAIPAAADTKTSQSLAAAQPDGFLIDFGQGFQAEFSGIKTKSFQRQDPTKGAGVSYSVTSGDITQSNLSVSGLKNMQVRQRYQTSLYLVSGREKLHLQTLGSYLSGWNTLKGYQNTFALNKLQHLTFKAVSHATLENALRREARARRFSRQKLDFWLKAIRRTRSANDAPCRIELDNAQWQISGQLSNGRNIHKSIRMDS